MNEERQARLEERIRGLQRSFLESLPNLVVKIVDYWNTLRHTGWDGIVLMELKAIIHRLAGSGGTFGFPDISRIAATLDAALTNTVPQVLLKSTFYRLNAYFLLH